MSAVGRGDLAVVELLYDRGADLERIPKDPIFGGR